MKSDDNKDDAGILQELIAEFLDAANRGESVDRDALLKQHPECADSLLEFFSSHDRMESTAGINAATLPLSPEAGEQSMLPLESAKDEDTLVFQTNRDTQEKRHSNVGDQVRYFGNYELLSELARGGMGVVYKARQVNLNRIVAVKMILSGQLASAEDVSRFYIEAEAAASLDHPGIVPIYEIGQHEGQHFFAMAFVEGMSLQQLVRDGPLPPREAAKITLKVAEAIGYAHEKGVIHRDLKPSNVLLDHKGEPKVTDFGLASKIDGDSGLTRTGAVIGTPSYMPPEQASGKLENVGPRSDVYSMGAILYCLLTGRPPFQSANPMDTLIQVLETDLITPRTLDPKIPIDLNTVCLKCLEKDLERRYITASELSDDLQRYVQGEPITAKPPSLLRLVRHWIGQNIGAIGWAVVVGVLLGLFASFHTLQTEIATALSGVGTRLDRLDFARELHPSLAHLPTIPPWLHAIQQFTLIVLLVMAGLIVVALVRPKNRPADVIAGTLSGLAAASVWFLLCLSWVSVYSKMQNTVWDLIEIKQSESSGELSGRVLARYPDLQFADPEKQIQIAWILARHRQVIIAAMGMIDGLTASLLVFVPACLCETMLAGRLTRQRKSVRAAVIPYMEIGMPVGIFFANFVLNQLLVWLGLARTSVPMWMSTLLYFPLMAAILGVSKQIHWPWRVILHLLWVGAVAAIGIWSVQVANESQRARPVLGVATADNPDVCVLEKVLPGSPAARAGLRPGDVIEELDGQAVSNIEELVKSIQGKRIGQTVNIIFRRDGTKHERQVELLSIEE